jgi:hypothetical protein
MISIPNYMNQNVEFEIWNHIIAFAMRLHFGWILKKKKTTKPCTSALEFELRENTSNIKIFVLEGTFAIFF